MSQMDKGGPWFWKDPALSHFLPFWKQITKADESPNYKDSNIQLRNYYRNRIGIKGEVQEMDNLCG